MSCDLWLSSIVHELLVNKTKRLGMELSKIQRARQRVKNRWKNLWLKCIQFLWDTVSMLFSDLSYGGSNKLALVYMRYFEIVSWLKKCFSPMYVPIGLSNNNSDSKRLFVPMVTNSYITIWRHYEHRNGWLWQDISTQCMISKMLAKIPAKYW